MNRNSLTTAVVAGIAGVAGFAGLANAVDLNPDGLGQVLLYPYFTVNKSADTQFSVVNTSNVGKAVKVRFLEGYNSREVLDFNLYLSAHDVWTASIGAVSSDDTSGAQLKWGDKSCIDFLNKNPYPFLPYGYDGTLASNGQPADSGPQDITRTREGYFEIIAMGDIVPGSDLETAITHVQPNPPQPDAGVPGAASGAPGNCPGISALAGSSTQLVAPTGGLFGGAAVINVGEGTYYSYNAEAIDGFTEISLYTNPSSLLPTLQAANTPSVATNGVARSYVFTEGGALLTVDYNTGRDAVSAVLMADSIYNEYYVDKDFGASSDWVITFPTKRFYVDKQLYSTNPTQPFEVPFADGKSNVLIAPSIYDREEGTSVLSQCPSPIGPDCILTNPNLPYEVNVVSFTTEGGASSSAVFGSKLYKSVPAFGNDGWAKFDLYASTHTLPGGTTPAGSAISLNGLPVLGFYATNVINSNAQPGKLANYSGVFRHKAHRSCSGSDPACS